MKIMNFLNKALIGSLGTYVISNIIEHKMKEYDTEVLKPIDTVSIIIPSFNEEQFIGTTLSSLRNQSIVQQYPEYFEFILADSCSTDGTIDIATPYVDRVLITSRGKLTARNEATDQANGNIVVSVDGDTYYPYHWLNSLLAPFKMNPKYEDVVGVFGSTFDYTINNIPGQLFSLADFLYNSTLNTTRMVGRNSAYRKWAFFLANRFDENVNQFDILSIFSEEERAFGQRLSKLGKVIYKLNASCYHMGGFKTIGRLGFCSKQTMDKYQFGKDRF